MDSHRLEVLGDIYEYMNIIKKIFYNNNNNNNNNNLYNLIKIGFHPVQGQVFQYIMENRAFTTYAIMRSLSLTRNDVYPIVQKLEDMGYICKHSVFKSGRGPSTHVYLVVGSNSDCANKARVLHERLKGESKPLPLYHYMDNGLVNSIIQQVKTESFRGQDYVDAREIHGKIREELGSTNMDLFRDVCSKLKENGLEISL